MYSFAVSGGAWINDWIHHLSPSITKTQRERLALDETIAMRWLAEGHQPYLHWHREKIFAAR